MSTIVTRSGKGSALTFAEVDSNFTNLNTDKYQSGSTASLASLTLAAPLPVTSGGTNASTASITSFNNITGYAAIGATGATSTDLVFSGSPTIATPDINGGTADGLTSVSAASGFFAHAHTLTGNYVFPNAHNAVGLGPITFQNGSSVTVSTDCRWMIL